MAGGLIDRNLACSASGKRNPINAGRFDETNGSFLRNVAGVPVQQVVLVLDHELRFVPASVGVRGDIRTPLGHRLHQTSRRIHAMRATVVRIPKCKRMLQLAQLCAVNVWLRVWTRSWMLVAPRASW